jgi:hypothetical protein
MRFTDLKINAKYIRWQFAYGSCYIRLNAIWEVLRLNSECCIFEQFSHTSGTFAKNKQFGWKGIGCSLSIALGKLAKVWLHTIQSKKDNTLV